MSSRYGLAAPHFKEWAEALTQSAAPLSHVAVDEILFVEDTETETKSDSKKYMELKRIPEFTEDFLGQQFGVARKGFALIIYRLNCGALDQEQMLARLYEELWKIPDEGKALRKLDVHTCSDLANAQGFGHNWKHKVREKLPNLLKDRPKGWPAKQVQTSLFEGTKPPSTTQNPPAEVAAASEPAQSAAGADAPPNEDEIPWQPVEVYVVPDNVVQFPGGESKPAAATGTEGSD